MPISAIPSQENDQVFCIGQPDSYPTFYLSKGYTKGYYGNDLIFGTDELGPLKHNCWTYWGHSGAPIINLKG